MAETKPIRTTDVPPGFTAERQLRTVEQTINELPPQPTPTQEEADAIMLGEYVPDDIEHPAPVDETPEAAERRKKREAKAQADNQAGYQTR